MVSLVIILFSFSCLPALAQDQDFIVISEGDVISPPSPEKLDLKFTLSGTYGYSQEGSRWTSIETDANLSLGIFDLSGKLLYGNSEKSASLGLATRLGILNFSSDLNWFWFPRKAPRVNLRAALQLGPLGLSGNTALSLTSGTLDNPKVGATFRLGLLTLSGNSTLDLNSMTIKDSSIGTNLQLGPLGFSASVSEISNTYNGGVGADFTLGPINLSTNASIDFSGLGGSVAIKSKSVGLTFQGKVLTFSGIVLDEAASGYGLDSTLTLQFEKLRVSSNIRIDSNSYSVNTTIEPQLGILNIPLTIGVDKDGFKWMELGGKITL